MAEMIATHDGRENRMWLDLSHGCALVCVSVVYKPEHHASILHREELSATPSGPGVPPCSLGGLDRPADTITGRRNYLDEVTWPHVSFILRPQAIAASTLSLR